VIPGHADVESRAPVATTMRGVAANTAWLLLDRIGRMGVGLLLSVWLARSQGPESFGLWSYVLALAALFSALAGLGLDGIVVRELVRTPDRSQELLGSAALLKALAGVAACLMGLAAVRLLRPGDELVLKLMALSTLAFLFQPADVVEFLFQSRLEQRFAVLARSAAFLVFAGIKVALLIRHAGLMAFAWATLAEVILGSALLLATYQVRHGAVRAWQARASVVAQLLRDSWPLTLAAVVVVVYMKMSQVIVGDRLGQRALGIFSAATRLSEVWYFLPVVVTTSILPLLVSARSRGLASFHRQLQRLYDVLAWMSLAVAAVVTFLADWIVATVYGAQYEGAGEILAIQIWAAVFVYLGVASSQYLLAENLTRVAFLRTALGALVNVIATWMVVPMWGVRGAALASVLAYAVATFSMAVDSRTRLTVRMMLHSFNPLRVMGRGTPGGGTAE